MRKKCQPHLWLLTGTREGHVFTESLLNDGWKITVSVVSKRASIPYEKFSLEKILVGPLNSEDEVRSIILNARNNQNDIFCVVDLTHPFAVNITQTISRVCKEMDQQYIRYERSICDFSNAFIIKKFSDLSNYNIKNKSIMFAIGARRLKEAIFFAKSSEAKIYARILANPDSLKNALSISMLHKNLAVINPSFSTNGEIERALIRRWKIDGVVCRQSGGMTEILWHKICSSLRIKLWLLERPSDSVVLDSIDSYEKLNNRLKSININQ